MKIMIVCLIAILTCSCRKTNDISRSESSDKTMTKQDEILKIMRESYIREMEIGEYWLTVEDKDELRKMKEEYYAKPRYPEDILYLMTPGPGWVDIRDVYLILC